jgi:hypothetical protein
VQETIDKDLDRTFPHWQAFKHPVCAKDSQACAASANRDVMGRLGALL